MRMIKDEDGKGRGRKSSKMIKGDEEGQGSYLSCKMRRGRNRTWDLSSEHFLKSIDGEPCHAPQVKFGG